MKIAIFSDCYLDLPGGIPTVINLEKRELEKRGHTVCIFSSGYPRTATEIAKLAKKRIFLVPSCRIFGRGLTPIARRPRIIEKWLTKNHPEVADFDIFYIHYEAGCSIAGLRFARAHGIPAIQVMHGREDVGEPLVITRGFRTLVASALNWFHSWYLPHPVKIRRDDYLARTRAAAKMWELMVNHANFADYVITPSKHFAKKLAHYGVLQLLIALPHGLPDEICDLPHQVHEYSGIKARVEVPTGVTNTTIKARTKVPTKSQNTPVNSTKTPSEPHDDVLRLIWHSRVAPEKRIMSFLEALTMVKIPYHLDVYGSGIELKRAQKYAHKHHLPVIFHGQTDHDVIYRELLRAHLDILVSYNYDTFGMTLIEAESAGAPVLIADPDLREAIPSSSYFLSRTPHPADLAAELNSLAAHPEKIATMSQKMLSHRDDIKISRKIDKLEHLFDKLIKDKLSQREN